MSGPTLPTAATPGYDLYRGKVACTCLIQWLPVFERLLLAKHLIVHSIDILQLTGDNSLSGGTHAAGGVFDIKQYNEATVMVAREMGAPATWMRNMLYADGTPGNTHIHGVLSGCPHTSSAADWQITEQKAGRDGFADPHPDPHPDPSVYRTWPQGIAWANQQITTITQEDDMTEAETITLWKHAAARDTAAGRQLSDYVRQASGVNDLRAEVKALAAALPDVDGEQLTARVLERVDAALADVRVVLEPAPSVTT